jgi:hypothetical protein
MQDKVLKPKLRLGVIGAVAIVVVLGSFVANGVVVNRVHTEEKTAIAAAQVSKMVINPYAGWKTATLKYEHATFEYPSSWTLQDASWVPSDTPGLYSPGDNAELTSPTGLSVAINTGVEIFNNPIENPVVISSQLITTLGKRYALDFTELRPNTEYPDYVSQACVSQTEPPSLEFGMISGKTLVQYQGEVGAPAQDIICISPPKTKSFIEGIPLASFKSNSSFADARLIIESLKYQN